MIYFTSDTHFGHANMIKYCNRPFNDVQGMNEVLIRNWNLRVLDKDTIFHLGDFGFGPPVFLRSIIDRLNGKKFLITGSHDRRLVKNGFTADRLFLTDSVVPQMVLVGPMHILKGLVGVPEITLCHYSMRVWPKSHYGTWHLFGHSHGKLEGVGKSFDVGVDANQFRPISLDEVVERMESRPDNPNLVRKKL